MKHLQKYEAKLNDFLFLERKSIRKGNGKVKGIANTD